MYSRLARAAAVSRENFVLGLSGSFWQD